MSQTQIELKVDKETTFRDGNLNILCQQLAEQCSRKINKDTEELNNVIGHQI
jgi:hypothetical protein